MIFNHDTFSISFPDQKQDFSKIKTGFFTDVYSTRDLFYIDIYCCDV